MDISEFRRGRRPTLIVLPSGLEVEVRPVDLVDLVVAGSLPLDLITRLQSQAGDGDGQVVIDTAQITGEALGNIASFAGFFDAIADAAVVGVRYGDDIVPPQTVDLVPSVELSMTDKVAILQAARVGVAPLDPFPGQGRPGRDPSRDRVGLRVEAVGPDRDT